MKKVITYGTFDLFHEGHRRLLERAKSLGDYLIVGVTSDKYDRERGKLNVRDSLQTRIESVLASGFADEIVIEEYLGQKVSDIERLNVDVFVIGSDWRGKFDYLAKYCEVVYLERTIGVSSTDLRKEGPKLLRMGIITDSLDDGGICAQTHFVSGLEISGVYFTAEEAEGDADSAETFRAKYELLKAFDSENDLYEWNSVVYIHTRRNHRFKYASAALNSGCNVVCDVPLDSPEETEEIKRTAGEKGLVFAEYTPIAYLLSETTQMIESGRFESIALSHDEAERLVDLLEQGDLL